MFVVAIHSRQRPSHERLRHLQHHRIPLPGDLVCDLFFDSRRFRLVADDDLLTLEEATADLGTVFSCSRRTSTCQVANPLMLGLPVYFSSDRRGFFASTSAKLLQACGVSLEENRAVLPEYFVYRYVTPPRTLFTFVQSMPVGAHLTVQLEPTAAVPGPLRWTAVFQRDRVRYTFEANVDRCVGDLSARVSGLSRQPRSVACLLSGGLDSSALFKLGKDRLGLAESHSTGYPFENPIYERERGERFYAETAAAALGSRHRYHEYSTEQFLSGMVDAIHHAETPLIHLQSVMFNLLFCHGLSASDAIVLNGQGADGLVGLTLMFNYVDKRYLIRRELAWLHEAASAVVSEGFFPFGRLARWSRRTWDLDVASPSHALWMMGVFGDPAWVKSHFGVDDEQIISGRLAAIRNFTLESPLDAFSILDFVSDVAVTQGLWGSLAAAHGHTNFYAFNSPGMIKAAVDCSWEDKLARPKRLMAAVGERLGLPTFILERPKLGFGIKSARWSAPGGHAEPLLRLAAPAVDVELVRRFQRPEENQAMIYWNWLNYGIWKRLIVDAEPVERLQSELAEVIRSHQ